MPTHHPTGPQHHGFYGRAKELAWLRSQFDAVAARGADGKFAGPRMAFIVAESGIGKSRLVQELYLRLTNDPQWDPPEVNYWPDAFREVGAQLRTVPDMRGHVPAGPPRFAWLGARWQPTDVRNVSERRSVLPEIRSSVTTHAEVLKSHGSAWAEAAGRVGEVFRNEGVGAAADAIGIPFFGLLTKVAKSVKDMATDRLAGPKSFDRVESNEIKSEIDEVLDCMRLLLDGKGAVPTVLWLDDAQWTDAETLEFVRTLWDQAQRRRWPLLIAVTHWEREWRELAQARRKGDADPSLVDFEGQRSVDTLHLANAVNDALRDYLAQRLPGLTPEQQLLLVEKAGGNFLTMVENTGELFSEPMWFVGERIDGALTDDAVAHIVEFETERERRVEQRFKALETEVKKILGWSTEMGSRFLADVVLEFAREKSPQLDPRHVLDKCVDPYAVLGRPSPYTREFRDKVFHHVAREHFQKFLKGDAARLSVVLRRHLVEWINNSFDAEGNEIWPDEERGIAAPERSATGLTNEERRDLLGMALKELPLPEKPDWTKAEDVAAFRLRLLAIQHAAANDLWSMAEACCESLGSIALADIPELILPLPLLEELFHASSEVSARALRRAAASVLLRRYGCGSRDGTTSGTGEPSDDSKQLNWPIVLRIAQLEAWGLGDMTTATHRLLSVRAVVERDWGVADLWQLLDYWETLARFGILHPEQPGLDVDASQRAVIFAELIVGQYLCRSGDAIRIAEVHALHAALICERANQQADAILHYRRAVELVRSHGGSDMTPSIAEWRVRSAEIEDPQGNTPAVFLALTDWMAQCRSAFDATPCRESLEALGKSTVRLSQYLIRNPGHGSASESVSAYLEALTTNIELLPTAERLDAIDECHTLLARDAQARREPYAAKSHLLSSLAVRRERAAEIASRGRMWDVQVALSRLVDCFASLGEFEDALCAAEERSEVLERLVSEDDTPLFVRERIFSLAKAAELQARIGASSVAETRRRQALREATRFADEHGSETPWTESAIEIARAFMESEMRFECSRFLGAACRSLNRRPPDTELDGRYLKAGAELWELYRSAVTSDEMSEIALARCAEQVIRWRSAEALLIQKESPE